MFTGNAVVWRDNKLRPFTVKSFSKEFYKFLNLNSEIYNLGKLRNDIQVLEKITEEIEQDN